MVPSVNGNNLADSRQHDLEIPELFNRRLTEGLSPLMVRTLIEAIRQIQQEGVTLLIADQNVKFARRVADRGYIMEKGNIRHFGRLEELWANEQILRRYLAV